MGIHAGSTIQGVHIVSAIHCDWSNVRDTESAVFRAGFALDLRDRPRVMFFGNSASSLRICAEECPTVATNESNPALCLNAVNASLLNYVRRLPEAGILTAEGCLVDVPATVSVMNRCTPIGDTVSAEGVWIEIAAVVSVSDSLTKITIVPEQSSQPPNCRVMISGYVGSTNGLGDNLTQHLYPASLDQVLLPSTIKPRFCVGCCSNIHCDCTLGAVVGVQFANHQCAER